MDQDRTYIVSSNMALRFSPMGTLTVETASSRGRLQIKSDALDVLVAFSQKPLTLDEAFNDLSESWDIDRDEFDAVVGGWVANGVLVPREETDPLPGRLDVFRHAMQEWTSQGAQGQFPLESPLPFQNPVLYYPGLESREIYPSERFSWIPMLEEAAPTILREMYDVRKAERSFTTAYTRFTAEGEWAAAFLWAYGKPVKDACDLCPETMGLLDKLPIARETGTVFFSALAPHTSVIPHYGNSNAKLRCQLPLRVPGRSILKVADTEIELTEGRCLVFDDSFLHTAWTEADEPRYALIFDFYHPDLTPGEVEYLRDLFKGVRGERHLDSAVEDSFPGWLRADT